MLAVVITSQMRPAMSRLPPQTWRCRVAALLDDPVAQAVLRRDGLTGDGVIAQMAPIARWLSDSRKAECQRQEAA